MWQHMWRCCLLQKHIEDSVPRGFTKGWSNRHPLPGANQNSRLAEGKQMCTINHPAWFQHSPFSLLGMGGTLPKAKFPDANQGPAQQAGLSKNSSTLHASWASFCCFPHVQIMLGTKQLLCGAAVLCGANRHTWRLQEEFENPWNIWLFSKEWNRN